MLRAQNITVRIGATTLLEDVDCTLTSGELVAVLGCNGAGKSTLLGAVCGDLRFQGGSVHLNERPLRDYRMGDLARIRAVMPQSVQLGFPFQAHEVVALGRMPFNEPRARTREAVRQCMALTETAHLQTQVYPTLSGGEKQRVQLARVLSQLWPFAPDQRQYLFLDEATASLDPLHQQQVFSLARQLATRGLGVMAVVHDINLASQFADRVLVLRQGRLLAEGTPQAVLTPALIAEAFSGLRVQCTPDAQTGQPWVLPLADQPLPRLGEALAD